MSFFAIISLILMYLCFGIFTWQFWLLSVISARKDLDKIEKLANIPLLIFLLFWPISILILIWILASKN